MKIYFSDDLNTVLDTDIIKGFNMFVDYTYRRMLPEDYINPIGHFTIIIRLEKESIRLDYANDIDNYKETATISWQNLQKDYKTLLDYFKEQQTK